MFRISRLVTAAILICCVSGGFGYAFDLDQRIDQKNPAKIGNWKKMGGSVLPPGLRLIGL